MLLTFRHKPLIFATGLLLLAAMPSLPDLPICLIRSTLGIPCPTCGLTHAVWYFMHGRFADAWASNPLSFLVVMIVIRLLLVRRPTASERLKKFDVAMVALIIIAGVGKAVTNLPITIAAGTF